jgi:hypothetical protein
MSEPPYSEPQPRADAYTRPVARDQPYADQLFCRLASLLQAGLGSVVLLLAFWPSEPESDHLPWLGANEAELLPLRCK